jgi:hypothetical protein
MKTYQSADGTRTLSIVSAKKKASPKTPVSPVVKGLIQRQLRCTKTDRLTHDYLADAPEIVGMAGSIAAKVKGGMTSHQFGAALVLAGCAYIRGHEGELAGMALDDLVREIGRHVAAGYVSDELPD